METDDDGSGRRKKRGKNLGDLRVVGKTTDGRPVVGGFFRVVSSEGIPLEVVLQVLDKGGQVPDWYGFWKEALSSGWKPGPTVTKIETAVGEVLGPKVREQVSEVLQFLLRVEEAEDDEEVKKILIERRNNTRA